MCKIDLNEQFIVYAIYDGHEKWYISDKEIWYLDYKKRIEEYKYAGYEIKEEYIDVRRRDILCINRDNVLQFVKRIEPDQCSVTTLKKLFLNEQEPDEYKPSLYVDFDKRILYSMYAEPASYEDYGPAGWEAKYADFLNLIPEKERYWQD